MFGKAQKMEPQAIMFLHTLWWMDMTQGLLALFFGVTALFWPALSLMTLVYLFSAYIFGIGIIEIIYGSISAKEQRGWWMKVLVGLIALGMGTYLVRHVSVSFKSFVIILGLTLIARGIVDTLRVFTEKVSVMHRGLHVTAGIAAIVAGIIILFQSTSDNVAFVWVLGLYALLYGAAFIATSFGQLRELQESDL